MLMPEAINDGVPVVMARKSQGHLRSVHMDNVDRPLCEFCFSSENKEIQ